MPRLEENPVHLGRGGSATVEPPIDGPAWFEAYAARHRADGAEGRLVSRYRFTESWTQWEMHPAGAELVVCIAGRLALLQEAPDGSRTRIELAAGDYAHNPPGTWHTAELEPGGSADCIFVTAGLGTQHRPR